MNAVLAEIAAYLRGAWRFRWYAVAITWATTVAAYAGLALMPDSYEAKSQIYVDTQSMLKPLLEGLAVSPNTDAEANVVQRALLSPPMLQKVARESGLMARAKTPADEENLLASLEKKIEIASDKRLSIYTITYADPSPAMAQTVVQHLLDAFVQGSMGQDRSNAESAQVFLTAQVKEYEARLTEAEQRLAEFKKQNLGMMPDESGDYFSRLQQESGQVDKLTTDLQVALRQQAELRSKIAGSNSGRMPSASEIQSATQVDAQLAQSRRQLDEMLLKYTEEHPQVVALKDTISRLEARRATELGNVIATSAGLGGNSTAGGQSDSVVQNVQIALNGVDVQVASLRTQLAASQARVSELKKLLTIGPEVEARLAQLNRDYGVTKSRYEELIKRLESARISDRADQSTEVKFRVLEPPRLPIQPDRPFMRTALAIGSTIMALALGIAVALGLGVMKPVVLDTSDLSHLSRLSMLGVISKTPSEQEEARRKREASLLFASAAAYGAICVVFIAFAGRIASALQQTVA